MTTTSKDLGGWISTFTNRKFYPCNPRPEDLSIEDIAHALSMICRFTGHLRTFYSVAEHSVRVMRLVRQWCGPGDYTQMIRTALLHDASEAYLCDVARPVKHSEQMVGYRLIEAKLEHVIAEAFDLFHPLPRLIKDADDMLLATEARDLHPGYGPDWRHHGMVSLPETIVPWAQETAKAFFLREFASVKCATATVSEPDAGHLFADLAKPTDTRAIKG